MSGKRYLILAEGRSDDPHYGKTARGVIHYAADPTVAILDSTHAGETYNGIPIVATVNDALCFNPTTAIVGVATQGGRFPPEWRDLLKSSIAKGLDVENGLHEFLTEDAEMAELARRHGVELRDLRKPPSDLNVPSGENLQIPARIALMVGSDCAVGKKTVAIELDREARRRGLASVFVPTGQTGMAWGRAPLRGGARLARQPGLLGSHARPYARLRTARVRSLPHPGHDGGGGLPGAPTAEPA